MILPSGITCAYAVITKQALVDGGPDYRLTVIRIVQEKIRWKLEEIGVPQDQHALHWLRYIEHRSVYEYMLLVPAAANVIITADDKMKWRTGNPFARRRLRPKPVSIKLDEVLDPNSWYPDVW